MKSIVPSIIVSLILIVTLLPVLDCGISKPREDLIKNDSSTYFVDNVSVYHYVAPETQIKLLNIVSNNYTKFIEPPEIEGGIDSLLSKIKYPEIAKRALVEGEVTCEFKVNNNGETSDIKIKRGIGAHCDENIIEALKAQKFIPAEKDGKAVDQLMRATFIFKIIKDKKP